jgi:predicted peptidase
MPSRRLAAVAAALGLLVPAFAQDKMKTGFVNKTFKNADGTTSPYVVFVPHSYDGTKAVPVILFLHGAGETKGGKMMPVEQGIGNHLRGRREKSFPAIVVIPQSEKRTWQAESDDGKRAIAILDAVTKEYKTDPARTYLTGLSMGGYGTWSVAAAYPDRWAAIVPICGGVRAKDEAESTAAKIKDIPCWCWHGDQDKAVPAERSRVLIEALKKAGGNPRYTELEWVGHNSWDAAYASDDLYAWLFAQKKK